MSESKNKEAADAIAAFQKLLSDFHKQQAARDEAERKRVAALTPAQRAAEVRAKAEGDARAERQKLTQKIAKMGDPIRKADTWTIAKFCWLLLAENPTEPAGFTFFDGRSSKATVLHAEFCAILESCVHTRLAPVNPKDPAHALRFPVQDLLSVAREKRLGCYEVLADFLGLPVKEMKPAPATQHLAARGTESRERGRARRLSDLVNAARAIAAGGEGSIKSDHIALSIHGKELNKRFKAQFPEWSRITDKTLEEDRSVCKPRISVITGRPRKTTD